MDPPAAHALTPPSRSRARGALAVAVLAGLALLAGPPDTSPAPPVQGVFEPGESLGGVRLGMTKAQVKGVWGKRFGRCRTCAQETWYFNYRPFEPQGTGVTFVRGRVASVFTVWQPSGWHTSGGLTLGASEREITQEVGSLERRRCLGYQALLLRGFSSRSVFYVYEQALWGFALMRPTLSPC
jgi:hypothetical protein